MLAVLLCDMFQDVHQQQQSIAMAPKYIQDDWNSGELHLLRWQAPLVLREAKTVWLLSSFLPLFLAAFTLPETNVAPEN